MGFSTIHYLLEWTIIGEEKAIKQLTNNPKTILDVRLTGTADFAISASKLKKIKDYWN